MNRKVEVLAPAGSFDALIAAAESGADAVYFGGSRFSARQYADNFGNDDLKRAIDYLHVRGVSAYIALNTLLYAQELDEALELAAVAYGLGVDAFIVQDLGLSKMLRQVLPEAQLHASTQMTVHNPQGCEALSHLGFSRVILARELGLEDIKAIRQAEPSIDLEVFVHGALCFSYSGQCLMSSMVGGRSGNRGRCAQPCRLEYSLIELGSRRPVKGFESTAGHLLSPSDLCLIDCIPDLVRAGVTALKIEGRMKRPEYVATVTRAYRQAVDMFHELGHIPTEWLNEIMDELAVSFNRGFTKAYFYGTPAKDLMSPGRPSNRGSYIGRVSKVVLGGSSNRIQVRLESDLSRGDGIEVWVSKGGRAGKVVEEMFVGGKPVKTAQSGELVEIVIRGRARVGDRVFKTLDVEVMREARQAFASSRAQRQIPVRFVASAHCGEPLQLTLSDGDGNVVTCVSDYIVEQASNHPTHVDDIRENLFRTGNTPFKPDEITVNIGDGVMVPRSVVNECRRRCVQQLEASRAESHRRTVRSRDFMGLVKRSIQEKQQEVVRLPGISVSTGTLDRLGELIDAGPDRIYLSLEGFGSDGDCLWNAGKLEDALELVSGKDPEIFIRLPKILKCADMDRVIGRIEDALTSREQIVSGFLVGNIGAAGAVAERLTQFLRVCGRESRTQDGKVSSTPIHADYSIGVMNPWTVDALRDLGFGGVTASPELNIGQMKQLLKSSNLPVEIIVHGRFPLMISEQCVIGYLSQCDRRGEACTRGRKGYGLLDRRGYVFPLYSDQFCRTHILNSMCMCMLDSIDALRALDWAQLLRIEGYGETNARLARVVSAYKEAIAGGFDLPSCSSLGIGIVSGYTRGHFFRGAE